MRAAAYLARKALQVTQRRRLLLALVQACAQRLEQLTHACAVVELGRDVALACPHDARRRHSAARRELRPRPVLERFPADRAA